MTFQSPELHETHVVQVDLNLLLHKCIIHDKLGRYAENQNGKGLTLVQALGSRGDRSLLID